MAKWTKQTYEMVAVILHENRRTVEGFRSALPAPDGQLGLIDLIAADFANRFARDNDGFNRTKFLEAVETGKHIRKGA